MWNTNNLRIAFTKECLLVKKALENSLPAIYHNSVKRCSQTKITNCKFIADGFYSTF